MNDLTLVIPAKKEKESLPNVLEELKSYNLKILIVLEKEDLETIQAIKDYDCKIIYQNGKGYGDALITGINLVDTDLFCIFNADGSFNPNELDQMTQIIKTDNADLVFGTRYETNCGSEDDTIITLIGNFIFTKIGKLIFNLKITDILFTYIIGKTSSFKNLNLNNFDFRICVEIPIKAKLRKMNYICIPSFERERIGGKKKVNAIKDGLLILSEIVKYFFKGKR